MSLDTSKSGQLQIRLRTEDESISVPTTTLNVPAKIAPEGLKALVFKLLEEDHDVDELLGGQGLEFLLMDDFLRGPLDEFLSAKGDVSAESVLELHYLRSQPTPEPHKSVNHDDWVAGVAVRNDYVLTACYDNSVSIFSLSTGERKLAIPGHSGPARDVAWISLDDNYGTFVSSAHDQTVMLYKWNVRENSIECMNAGRGHERSVDCVAVDREGKRIASGSFDTTLKIWGAKVETRDSGEASSTGDGESDIKKSRADGSAKALTRTPIMTLAGHKEGISGVDWTDEGEVITSSWDHTLKIWDLEMGGMKSELVGNKSFFGLSYSPINKTIVTAAADRTIRLFDPRSKDGVIVKSQYTSHGGWVTCVDWCKTTEHHLLSGGHDMVLKMWDVRSCKTPLFDLKGHDDRVLCCDWGEARAVVSGGADNCMKIFNTNFK